MSHILPASFLIVTNLAKMLSNIRTFSSPPDCSTVFPSTQSTHKSHVRNSLVRCSSPCWKPPRPYCSTKRIASSAQEQACLDRPPGPLSSSFTHSTWLCVPPALGLLSVPRLSRRGLHHTEPICQVKCLPLHPCGTLIELHTLMRWPLSPHSWKLSFAPLTPCHLVHAPGMGTRPCALVNSIQDASHVLFNLESLTVPPGWMNEWMNVNFSNSVLHIGSRVSKQ